ncbi:hypothetical protein D3C78_1466070 [compost metagenome]
MALDLTNLATFQAKIRSWISCSLGARWVTTLRSASVIMPMSRLCTSRPPLTRLKSQPAARSAGHSPHSSRRTLAFAATTSRAAAETFGAMITSTNWRSTMALAVSPSSSRLKAMMPPNADSVSVA